MPKTNLKAVKNIRKGDKLINKMGYAAWTALEDAFQDDEGYVTVLVRFPDGGNSYRSWEDPEHRLEFQRGS